jgi:hypothetical protein
MFCEEQRAPFPSAIFKCCDDASRQAETLTMLLLTLMTAAFLGMIAAAALLALRDATASSGTLGASPERVPRSRPVTLIAAGAFAVVASLILYLISTGHMSAGLGAIAALGALITLALVARALR